MSSLNVSFRRPAGGEIPWVTNLRYHVGDVSLRFDMTFNYRTVTFSYTG